MERKRFRRIRQRLRPKGLPQPGTGVASQNRAVC